MRPVIERFDPRSHEARSVAKLIYEADPSLMGFVFGDAAAAVPVLARLVEMPGNEYSGVRTTCARVGGEVVGIIAGLTGLERREAKATTGKEWGKALGIKGMFRAIRYGPKLESVATTELADDEFYISALAVDERFRGQGIGSMLLDEVLREHPRVVTDVNIAKDDAIRFYERHGFRIQKKMTFEHGGAVLGNYQIRRG